MSLYSSLIFEILFSVTNVNVRKVPNWMILTANLCVSTLMNVKEAIVEVVNVTIYQTVLNVSAHLDLTYPMMENCARIRMSAPCQECALTECALTWMELLNVNAKLASNSAAREELVSMSMSAMKI